MHISLRCVIQKILPSWKPPLYLLILSLSQLQPCEKTQGFRASIGFPFMRCSSLSWLHSKVLRFAQRGASVTNVRSYREVRRRLKAIIPLVSCTSCYWFQGFGNPRRLLQICLYKQTPFKNNNIPHLSSNIFMDRFCPDLNKFPVFPCQTQNKKSPVSSPTPATASSCCRTVVPDEKKKHGTRLGGEAVLTGAVVWTQTNILKWHHFPFQYLKILNIMFQRDACLLKVPESPKPSLWHWSYSHLGVPGSIHLNLSEPTIHLLGGGDWRRNN